MEYLPTIYINNDDNSCRFALGSSGIKPLLVIGINPSTADDKKPDRTINRVIGFAEGNGFDSFIMLNIYPQRTPFPSDLHSSINLSIHNQNLKSISDILEKNNNTTILAAWSEKIIVRDYLNVCLKAIFETTKKFNVNWIKLGELTKSGHPRHPLYASYTLALNNFDITSYIEKLK
jgi:hypothetical protein